MLGYLTKKEEIKVIDFAKKIRDVLKDQFVLLEIFGSKVKGNPTPDSDIDILVVVKNKDLNIKSKIYDTLFEIDPYYEYKISLIVYSVFEYEQNLRLKSPFIENIEKEGIKLWIKNWTYLNTV